MLAITLSVMLSSLAAASEDDRPHAVIVVGTLHYSPELTMPVFAKELERFGFRTTVVMGKAIRRRRPKMCCRALKLWPTLTWQSSSCVF